MISNSGNTDYDFNVNKTKNTTRPRKSRFTLVSHFYIQFHSNYQINTFLYLKRIRSIWQYIMKIRTTKKDFHWIQKLKKGHVTNKPNYGIVIVSILYKWILLKLVYVLPRSGIAIPRSQSEGFLARFKRTCQSQPETNQNAASPEGGSSLTDT